MEKSYLKVDEVHEMLPYSIFVTPVAMEPYKNLPLGKVLTLPKDYDLCFFEEILSTISEDSDKCFEIRLIRENNQLFFSQLSQRNLRWLVEFHHFIELNYHQIDFKVPDLARELNMSVRSLYRKLKSVTSKTPNYYLREFRLLTARQMLSSERINSIKEVAYGIGFRKPSYFSQIFQERFALNPKDFLDGASF